MYIYYIYIYIYIYVYILDGCPRTAGRGHAKDARTHGRALSLGIHSRNAVRGDEAGKERSRPCKFKFVSHGERERRVLLCGRGEPASTTGATNASCHGPATTLPQPWYGLATALPRHCHNPGTALPQPCRSPAYTLPRHCRCLAIALVRQCHSTAAALVRHCQRQCRRRCFQVMFLKSQSEFG